MRLAYFLQIRKTHRGRLCAHLLNDLFERRHRGMVPLLTPNVNFCRPSRAGWRTQWVELQDAALRLFLRTMEQYLRPHSAGAGPVARLGAVAFIHRFGSSLNPHLHFHCVVLDGVFASAPAGGIVFLPATAIDAAAIAAVQAAVRRRLLGSFVRRGLLESDAARAMQAWRQGRGWHRMGGWRGPCCSPASMKCSRSAARAAAPTCGSSPSSPRQRGCATSSFTSASLA